MHQIYWTLYIILADGTNLFLSYQNINTLFKTFNGALKKNWNLVQGKRIIPK